MARIGTGGVRRRGPYTGGRFLIQAWRGQLHAQKWPRRRGRPKQDWQRASLERMAVSQKAVKRMPPEERRVMQEGLQRFMQTNTGVRGLAAIRLRDWLTQVMFGRAWTLVADSGEVLYSEAIHREVSDILDWTDPWLGSLLTRTNEEWLPTIQCEKGKVLCLTTNGQWPGGCPPAQLPPKHAAMGGH